MYIKIASLRNCPNCKQLTMLLNRQGIEYEYRLYDPNDVNDMAEMSYLDIYTAQFPVVWIDGKRLPAMTVADYMREILGVCID